VPGDGVERTPGYSKLSWLLHHLHEEEHSRFGIDLKHSHGATAGMCCSWRAGKYGSPWSLKGQCSCVADHHILREMELLLRHALAACDTALQEAVRYMDLDVDTEGQRPRCVRPSLALLRVSFAEFAGHAELPFRLIRNCAL